MSIFILSQVLAFCFYVFYGITYYTKSRNKILIFNSCGQILLALSFLLLGAYSGMTMNIVAFTRNVAFLIVGRQTSRITKRDLTIFGAVVISCIIFSFLTYTSFLGLLPIIATVAYSYSICQKNILIYRMLGAPVAALWFIYYVYVFSVVGIALQFFLVGFITYNYIKLRKEYANENEKK